MPSFVCHWSAQRCFGQLTQGIIVPKLYKTSCTGFVRSLHKACANPLTAKLPTFAMSRIDCTKHVQTFARALSMFHKKTTKNNAQSYLQRLCVNLVRALCKFVCFETAHFWCVPHNLHKTRAKISPSFLTVLRKKPMKTHV